MGLCNQSLMEKFQVEAKLSMKYLKGRRNLWPQINIQYLGQM